MERKRVRRFMGKSATLCVLLLTLLCAVAAAQEGEGTVAGTVLQMALQSGYTGDSPQEAADFLVANGILPREVIGDLDRPADEAFLSAMLDAGVAPELLISSAIRAGVEEGFLVTWALGAGIDAEVVIAEAIEAGGDAATIFRAAIEGGVDAGTALAACFEAGAELGEIVPVAMDLGISIGDAIAAALEAGLAQDEIATYIAPFVVGDYFLGRPDVRPTSSPYYY